MRQSALPHASPHVPQNEISHHNTPLMQLGVFDDAQSRHDLRPTTPAGRMMMQMVDGRGLRRVRTRHDPGTDICWLGCSARCGPHWRPAQEARSEQAPRNRRKRHLWPQDRCRDGAALQYQRADRVTHRRRRAPDQSRLAAGERQWPSTPTKSTRQSWRLLHLTLHDRARSAAGHGTKSGGLTA
jgi:hypothetical protein